MQRAFTNNNGVVTVYVVGESGRYTLSCNQGAERCVIPPKDFIYVLSSFSGENFRKYKCQNVQLLGTKNTGGTWKKSIMKNGNTPFLGLYCLDGVE